MNAAFGDNHPEPLKEEELNNISILVDVLSEPKPVEDIKQLKPHKHGILIEDDKGHQSLMLPGREGLDTVDKLMEAAKKEAGIDPDLPADQLKIYNFTATSYQ